MVGTSKSGRHSRQVEIQQWLEANALPSLETIEALAQSPSVEDSTRLQAAKTLVEQAIGKAPSRVDVVVGTDSSLLDLLSQLRGTRDGTPSALAEVGEILPPEDEIGEDSSEN